MLLAVSKKAREAVVTVSDMLKTADYNIESFSLNLENVNIQEFFKKIFDSLEHLIHLKHVKISTSIPPTLEIVADNKLLRAAVVNVLDNAIRYSPNGTVTVTAARSATAAAPSSVVITVVDSGIGISKEDTPYIFERFYRGKNAIAVDPNESGVGLYATKKIIERHGGTISFDSKEGAGTTVTINLPMKSRGR
jgi:signal transduction histidine kinase